MSANTPTTILSLDTAAQKYAYDNFGVPKDWQFVPSITQNTMSENIQEAYKEGYRSRDEEVAELRVVLQKIANWELPATDDFWDKEKKQPISYEAKYGSNGARDYIRNIAKIALV